MQAIVLRNVKQPLEIEHREPHEPGPGEVVVEIEAAALNRRDYWITQGMYPGIQLPIILGSDGCGLVKTVGTGVSSSWVNQPVVINPGWNWGDNEHYQSDRFAILGMPVDGTFTEQIVVPEWAIHKRPQHLDSVHAAALPLAGVTAYRALFTKGGLQPTDRVLITGAGGGVATYLIQFAAAIGCDVFVTSSSAEKVDSAIKLGAQKGFNYREENWAKQLINEVGTIDLIVDSAGGEGYLDLLKIASPGGRIVNYGATQGPVPSLDLFKLFWKQLHLIGSTMGSPQDFENMLSFVSQNKIQPVIDQVAPLIEHEKLFERMADSKQFGKLVLKIR
jgi:zinc-binding alcohol dehydrogenase/oxidoreductase